MTATLTRRGLILGAGAAATVLTFPATARAATTTAPDGLSAVGGLSQIVGPIVVNENFTGPNLNRDLWACDWSNGWHGGTSTGEVMWFTDKQVQMVNDRAGAVRLVARPATPADKVPAGYSYVSGLIRGLRSYTYGRLSITARFPTGPGTWPTLALFSAGWPPEVDLAEVINSELTSVHLTNHWLSSTGTDLQTGRGVGPYDVTKPHTYTLDWLPGLLVWYIDGRPVFADLNSPTAPMYPVALLGMGDSLSWAGANTGETAVLRIDNITISQWEGLAA
jgi:beta-glucanase (GH16 family)